MYIGTDGKLVRALATLVTDWPTMAYGGRDWWREMLTTTSRRGWTIPRASIPQNRHVLFGTQSTAMTWDTISSHISFFFSGLYRRCNNKKCFHPPLPFTLTSTWNERTNVIRFRWVFPVCVRGEKFSGRVENFYFSDWIIHFRPHVFLYFHGNGGRILLKNHLNIMFRVRGAYSSLPPFGRTCFRIIPTEL